MDLDLTMYLPSGWGLETEVDSAMYALAAIPERASDVEVALSMRVAALRLRSLARCLEAVASNMDHVAAA